MFLSQVALVYAENYLFFSEECFLVHVHLSKGISSGFRPNIYLTREGKCHQYAGSTLESRPLSRGMKGAGVTGSLRQVCLNLI